MKYIFVAGAPGSKWSSVVKNIYYSDSIDRSDYSDARTYHHDASGSMQLMHLGVYFDPGMEFSLPDNLDQHSKQDLEKIFDAPFAGKGVRVIKSHIFSNHIDFIKRTWADCPVVLVHRANDACLGWWVRCGQFDITYPNYSEYYQNLPTMARKIDQQNAGILDAWWGYKQGKYVETNRQLAQVLNIDPPPLQYAQDYATHDVRVMVI
jgi:hypothetical protein